MPSKSKTDFILLSELIQKLEDKDYYRTYAKSLALTENAKSPLPNDEKLVEQMFYYFIENKELEVYYNGTVVSEESIIKDNVYVKVQGKQMHSISKLIIKWTLYKINLNI